MITEQEREEIINAAVERTLLRIPEVVGNLISNYAAKIRLNKEFYSKYKEFNDHRGLVASVIEEIENSDPSKDVKEVMEESVPKIRERIKRLKSLDMKKVELPNLDLSHGDL